MLNRTHRSPSRIKSLRKLGFQVQTPEEHRDSSDLEPVAWLDNQDKLQTTETVAATYDEFLMVDGVIYAF